MSGEQNASVDGGAAFRDSIPADGAPVEVEPEAQSPVTPPCRPRNDFWSTAIMPPDFSHIRHGQNGIAVSGGPYIQPDFAESLNRVLFGAGRSIAGGCGYKNPGTARRPIPGHEDGAPQKITLPQDHPLRKQLQFIRHSRQLTEVAWKDMAARRPELSGEMIWTPRSMYEEDMKRHCAEEHQIIDWIERMENGESYRSVVAYPSIGKKCFDWEINEQRNAAANAERSRGRMGNLDPRGNDLAHQCYQQPSSSRLRSCDVPILSIEKDDGEENDEPKARSKKEEAKVKEEEGPKSRRKRLRVVETRGNGGDERR